MVRKFRHVQSIILSQKRFVLQLTDTQKTFNTNGIDSLLVEGRDHKLCENNFPNTMDTIVKFVEMSSSLSKAFKIKCNMTLSARKKSAEVYYRVSHKYLTHLENHKKMNEM